MKQNDLKLDKDVHAFLEEELGCNVPEPNSPDFQLFLEDLHVNRPDLFEKLMQGLQVDITLPVQEQAQRAARRESVNTATRRLFFRRSQVDGEDVAAKRRVMTYVLGGMACLLPLLYVLGQAFSSGEPVAQSVPEPVVNIAVSEIPTVPSLPVESVVATPPPLPQMASLLPPPKLPPPPQSQAKTPQPPAPPSVAPPVLEPQAPTTLALYTSDDRPKQPMLVYADRQERPDELGVQQAVSAPGSMTLSINQGSERPSSFAITSETSENVATGESLSVFAAQDAGAETQPRQAVLGQAEGSTQAASDLPLPPTSQAIDPSSFSPTETATATSGETVAAVDLFANFVAGSRLPARLVTGVIVAEGTTIPIVAETKGDWCAGGDCPKITWIGQAGLDATGRVQITFTEAVMEGSVKTVSSLALGEDEAPGLSASIRDESPSFVQTLLQTSVGGVADYVQALTQRQKVTIINGVAITERDVPNVDNFILGRVASLFSTPSQQEASVRIAEVAAETPLTVLYGVGNTTP